jgi:DNA repair exonuclease SbcCD ATPase subunit
MEYRDKLKDVIGSAEKREDYAAVKDLGEQMAGKLGLAEAALDTASGGSSDSSNVAFIRDACSPTLAAARAAKQRAEKLREKGDAKQNCLPEALALQQAMEEFSKNFEKSYRQHEEYKQKLEDNFRRSLDNWISTNKDVAKPMDELAKKSEEAFDRANELRARAKDVFRACREARERSDSARAELFKADPSRTADELKAKYDEWTKADDILLQLIPARAELEKRIAEAEKNYSEAYNAYQRAAEEFRKKELDGNEQYKVVVLGHQRKMLDFRNSYTPFSW